MIENFHHKGLKRFYEQGETWFLPAEQLDKIKRILSFLDSIQQPEDMNLPGFRFHQMTGNYKGFYSVTVTGNWRIIFRFQEGNVIDITYLDYH